MSTVCNKNNVSNQQTIQTSAGGKAKLTFNPFLMDECRPSTHRTNPIDWVLTMWPAVPASTRRVYEKKLQRLQEESDSPVTPELPLIVMETEVHHNGHADVNQFSDQEDGESIIIIT